MVFPLFPYFSELLVDSFALLVIPGGWPDDSFGKHAFGGPAMLFPGEELPEIVARFALPIPDPAGKGWAADGEPEGAEASQDEIKAPRGNAGSAPLQVVIPKASPPGRALGGGDEGE